MAKKMGLILVDTKYEFGKKDGKIYLIDEIHTPDSSRYFYADGYEERFAKGEAQKQLSKEFVREWLMANGFQGRAGEQVPEMTPEIISQIEFSARGFGKPLLDPYHFISAGLYDFHEGKIGAGNEKGIAFARDEISMIGFSSIDFGKAGSDTLILPIFALDGKRVYLYNYDTCLIEWVRVCTHTTYYIYWRTLLWNGGKY